MGSAELSALLFRPEMLQKWIGQGVELPLHRGALAILPTPDGSLRQSVVTRVTNDEEGRFHSLTAEGPGTRFTISLAPGTGVDESIVRIAVGRMKAASEVRTSLAFWQAALTRLTYMVNEIGKRRDSVKQAVIVIHGIGEQRPGHTLTDFVKAVFDSELHEQHWVKPDTVSDSFEMRKVTVPALPASAASEGMPATDVYEMYWAHLILDSTVGQVMGWMKGLLLRRVPPPLGPAVWTARLLSILILAVVAGLPIYLSLAPPDAARAGSLATVVVAVVLAAAGVAWKFAKQPGKKWVTGYLGDAARYLEPKPANIARRQEIREAGVRMLERIHESGQYERIVIVGHSLGSVIAYDILTFAWNRLRRQHKDPDHWSFEALQTVESALQEGSMPAEPRALQYAAWQEHRTNSQPWLVTDFVTLGSPLTYGDFLMTDRRTVFSSLVKDRIYPTCPPQTEEQDGKRRFSYTLPSRWDAGARHESITVPDHAALFALTRWTNLYFPKRGLIGGDPVGGPLRGLFGAWISDCPVKAPKAGLLGFAHTHYWEADRQTGSSIPEHIRCLRDALDLHTAGRMRDIAAHRPAHSYM